MIKESLRTLGPIVLLVAVVQLAGALLLLPPSELRPRNPIGYPTPIDAPVYFAPIGDVPAKEIYVLAFHYLEKFDLTIKVLPTIPIPADSFDPDRDQVVAEALIDAIGGSEAASQEPTSVIIGLTNMDMYIAARDWRYAYSLRGDDRFAVVSTARMGDGLFTDEARRMRRIQKMVTKNLGILYFWLPQSDDPGSVLYRNILGPDDLDRASEDF